MIYPVCNVIIENKSPDTFLKLASHNQAKVYRSYYIGSPSKTNLSVRGVGPTNLMLHHVHKLFKII